MSAAEEADDFYGNGGLGEEKGERTNDAGEDEPEEDDGSGSEDSVRSR